MIFKLTLYTQLRFLSCYRIWNELPVLIRLLAIGLLSILGYGLIISELILTVPHYLYCLGIYTVAGRWLCEIDPVEDVLIKSLDIPKTPILIAKGGMLCIPFFLLNAWIGSVLLPTGICMLYLLAKTKSRKRWVIPSFFHPAAYQWLSAWRAEGVWIYLLGMLFLSAGLRHENEKLVRFAILWIVCLPCFLSYYKRMDPKRFLSAYKTPHLLLRMKSVELLINSSLSLLLPIVLLLAFGTQDRFPFLWITGGVTGNFLLFYAYYIAYPSPLRALCILCAFAILYTIIYVGIAPWGQVAGVLLLPIFYFLSYLNLKMNLYARPLPEN